MKETYKVNLGIQILITLFSPILAAFNLFRSRNQKFIFISGVFLFAILGSIYVYIPGNDGLTHLKNVKESYLGMSVSTFFEIFEKLLTFQDVASGVSDPYIHILSYISGSVFGIPELLHVFAGLIYGIIYMKSVLFVTKNIKLNHLKVSLYLLLTVFFAYRGIAGINAIRWWTAFWLFFLSIVGYANTKNKKYIILGCLSPLIHFSFLLIGAPALIIYHFKKYQKGLFIIWIVSFFMGASYNLIKPYIPDFDAVNRRENVVLDEEAIALSQEGNTKDNANFYAVYGEEVFRNYAVVLLAGLVFYLNIKNPTTDIVFLTIFSAAIGTYILGNFMEFSPAVSGRSKAAAGVFIVTSSIRYFGFVIVHDKILFNKTLSTVLLSFFFILCIPVVLFQISYLLNIFSGFALIFPFISWFLGDQDVTIRQLIS
jgi:hypothetical protein